jgi:5-methylcytosine-specific restriction endonuclease McrA
LGLKDAKDLVDKAPSSVGKFSREYAAALRAELVSAGADATMTGAPSEDDASPLARRATTKAMRLAVWERDGGRCVECGSRFDLQYDHIIPLALGGAHTVENLQILCSTCNQKKGVSLG